MTPAQKTQRNSHIVSVIKQYRPETILPCEYIDVDVSGQKPLRKRQFFKQKSNFDNRVIIFMVCVCTDRFFCSSSDKHNIEYEHLHRYILYTDTQLNNLISNLVSNCNYVLLMDTLFLSFVQRKLLLVSQCHIQQKIFAGMRISAIT